MRSCHPLIQHEFLECHEIHIRIRLVLLDCALLVQIVKIVVVLVVRSVVHVALDSDTRARTRVLQLVRLIERRANPHDVLLDEIGSQKGRCLLGKVRIQVNVDAPLQNTNDGLGASVRVHGRIVARRPNLHYVRNTGRLAVVLAERNPQIRLQNIRPVLAEFCSLLFQGLIAPAARRGDAVLNRLVEVGELGSIQAELRAGDAIIEPLRRRREVCNGHMCTRGHVVHRERGRVF